MKNGLKDSENKDHQVIGKIIEDVRVAMITTALADGKLSSRPMWAQEIDEAGQLWFFTSDKGALVKEVQAKPFVNITFADKGDNEYLSGYAACEVSYDRAKMEELWDRSLQIWYKQGIETPGICLLKISFEDIEYWDAPGSAVVRVIGFIKAAAGGDTQNLGRHRKVDGPGLATSKH